MATLKEFRAQYPQYDDMNDSQLSDAIYRKHYSDMPRAEFNRKIGYTPSGQHLSFEEGQELLEQENQSGASGAAGAGLTGFLEGMPIVGPMLMGGAKRAAAGISSLIDGESYDENLQQAQRVTKAAQDAHPYVATGAKVAGAVAGTVPMIAAAPTMFGAGAGGLGARTVASGLTGTTIGGADAAVRSGGNLDDIGTGAKWGAAAGLAGPAVGAAVGAGARGAIDWLRNSQVAKLAGTSPRALGALENSLAADGLDAATVRTRLADLGPEGMMADLGPSTQAQAAGLAAMPGRAQSIVRGAVDARAAGANARIGQTVDDTLGPNVIPSQIDDAISQGQRALTPQYGDALGNARAVNTERLAGELESQIVNLRGEGQRAAQRVRNMLNINGTDVLDPNPATLLQVRQAIDGYMAAEANPQAIRVLTQARQQVDNLLADAVPHIKEIDGQYAELSRQSEALRRGQTVLDSGRTAPRPVELADEVWTGAQPQGMQVGPSAVPLRLSQGARAEVDRILGNNANDIHALNRLIKGEGDWNRERLATLFGPERANQLFRVLDNELTFARTRNAITGNSETARRQQAIAELGSPDGPDFAKNAFAYGGLTALPRVASVKLFDKIMNTLLKGRTEDANADLAGILAGNRGSVVDALAARQVQGYDPITVDRLTRAILLVTGTTSSR